MTLSNADVVRQFLVVLREAVEGPSGPWTHFIDNKPGAGLLGALDPLGAAEASRAWGGSSIAARREALGAAIGVIAHVAYHLGAVRQKLATARNP